MMASNRSRLRSFGMRRCRLGKRLLDSATFMRKLATGTSWSTRDPSCVVDWNSSELRGLRVGWRQCRLMSLVLTWASVISVMRWHWDTAGLCMMCRRYVPMGRPLRLHMPCVVRPAASPPSDTMRSEIWWLTSLRKSAGMWRWSLC